MEYSEELTNYQKNIDFEGNVIFDIGANEGDIIEFMIKHTHNSVIYGIEPHQHNINILNHKFKDNNRVIIMNGAVNNYDGECSIGLEEQERINGLKQGHVLNNENNIDLQGRDWEKKVNMVLCWKLENICKNADIIKMDIEGFEHKILYDSLQHLNYVHTWMIEIHSWEDIDLHGWTIGHHSKENDSLHKMLTLFNNNGYTTFILAKTRNSELKDVHLNTCWTDIPVSNYMQKGEKVYYKVVNLIIKR